MTARLHIVACLFLPTVLLIVPPKTPLLTGFGSVAIGSYLELTCDGYQPDAGNVTYEWFRQSDNSGNQSPIGTSDKYIFKQVTESHEFYPGAALLPVSGKYKCRATNTAGIRESQWRELFVYKHCSLYNVSVSPQAVTTGGDLTLSCHIPKPSGSTVKWKKVEIDLSTSGISSFTGGCFVPTYFLRYKCKATTSPSKALDFNIHVSNAAIFDSTYWFCEDEGLNCSSDQIRPAVQAPPGKPTITGFPSTRTTTLGVQLSLACTSTPPGDTYDWYKGDTKITSSSTFDFYVRKESAGAFKCVAKNNVGSATSNEMTLTVSWPATKLSMVKKPNSPISRETSINITCETDSSNSGSPVIISWYRNGWQITKGITPTTRSATDGGTIYISQLIVTASKDDNKAKYECKLDGQADLNDVTTTTVYFPPNGIELTETNITVNEGDSKDITCSTSSSSNPAVTGIAVTKRIGSNDVNVTEAPIITNGAYEGKEVSIVIKIDTNRKDNGAKYICSFSYTSTILYRETATVTVEWSASELKMVEKPSGGHKEGSQIDIKCVTDSSNSGSPGTISWYRNGQQVNTTGITASTRPATDGGTIYISQLTITARIEDDQAKYECNINDDAGFKKDVTLTVIAAPMTNFTITKREGNTVTAKWTPINRPYTDLRIKYCSKESPSVCGYHVVNDTKISEVTFVMKGVGMTENVVFSLEVFDGNRLIYQSGQIGKPVDGTGPDDSIWMIVGAVSGVVILVVIVAIIVMNRRRDACFAKNDGLSAPAFGGDTPLTSSPTSGAELDCVNVNPTFEDVITSSDEYVNAHMEHIPRDQGASGSSFTAVTENQLEYVPPVIYASRETMGQSTRNTSLPRNIEDYSIEEFKQWLLSKEVTEATYKILVKTGFHKAKFFLMLNRDADVRKLRIKPLAQEVLVRNLVIGLLPKGNGAKDESVASNHGQQLGYGDSGSYEDIATYAELDITPDVIAEHAAYTDLRLDPLK